MEFGTPEMRVAIAEDVIRHVIPERNIDVATGTYIKVADGKPCTVCAVGGLFIASLEQRGFDRFRYEGKNVVRDYENAINATVHSGRSDFLTNDEISAGLEANFSRTQLGMIEGAFERGYTGAWANMELPDEGCDLDRAHRYEDELSDQDLEIYRNVRAAIEWGTTLPADPARRLEKIMDNIIQNDGELVVPRRFYQ